MKISYVLPVYNGQAMIAQCLRSLLAQSVTPHQIIVIDDCSTDFTQRIIKNIDFGDIRVRYTKNKTRRGGAFCRNLGNSMATGKIIAVCDVDYYLPIRGEAISEFFRQNKDKSVFYSALECRSSKTPLDQWGVDAYEWDFNSKCPISHPTVAYLKKVGREVKYHEDSLQTDFYEFFLLDAHKKGYLFGGCQNPLMVKIEGDTVRDRSEARALKIAKYKEYGIEVAM